MTLREYKAAKAAAGYLRREIAELKSNPDLTIPADVRAHHIHWSQGRLDELLRGVNEYEREALLGRR